MGQQWMKSKPLISIVTPSLNQGRYLHSAMSSVLNQREINLEYVVIDGGSSDNSVSTIRDFANDPRLVYWCSEKDSGHYDAVNKGFAQTTGDVMAWLNSDDLYLPNTLGVVSSLFEKFPQIEWLTTTQHVHFNSLGEMVLCRYIGGYNKRAFWRGNNLINQRWFGRALIQQESTFWRRSLWERAGGYIDTSLKLAGDFELWTRFYRLADLFAVDVPLAGFRKHEKQKTANALGDYLVEASIVFTKAGGKPYGRLHSFLRKWFWYMTGYRSYQKMPHKLGGLLVSLGIFYPSKICVWDNGKWVIADDFVL